jgi:hypothetical protein
MALAVIVTIDVCLPVAVSRSRIDQLASNRSISGVETSVG